MKTHSVLYGVYRRLPVGLQNLMVTLKGRGRWAHESSPAFQKILRGLLDAQYYDEDAIREYRKARLTNVLLAAKLTDFYSRTLPSKEQIERDPFGVLSSVPVLSKEEVRADHRRFLSRVFKGKLIEHGTSGTTGTPLRTVWTSKCIDMERALIWRQRIETGLLFGNVWRGMLGGHQIVPLSQTKPPFWRVSKHSKQLYFSTYHLTEENAPYYKKSLDEYNIRALEGYPSVLYALAYTLDRCGLQHELEGIYYGAEPLLDNQRSVIERVFGCYVWDYYGLTERVASASEFECRNGLHENWENCILEIVDSAGRNVPDGEYGELVGTSLSNLGFPLLRYRTGDMSRFLPGKCTCSRSSRRIDRIDTKREDLLLMPDGSLLSASNLTFPFKEVENILESQLFQDSVNSIQVRIIPTPEYSDEDGKKLISGLKQMIPESVELHLRIVSEIPRTQAGKFRFCVCDLAGNPNSQEPRINTDSRS